MDELTNEKLECLRHISAEHRKILAARISQEWKVTLLALTFYSLVAISKSSKWALHFDISNYIYIAVVVSALVSIGFLYYLHQANAKNRFIAENSEKAMQEFVETGHVNFEAPNEDSLPKKLSLRSWFALFWQGLIIFSFALLSSLVATNGTG